MTSFVIFILGSSIASFLTAWADRYPKSILYPPSHCQTCMTPLNWWDLIPILSYIYLRGNCRNCQSAIPLSNLANEIQGGIFAYSCWQNWLSPSWTLFLFMSLMLSHFDRKSYSFPLCFWSIPHCFLTLILGLQYSPFFLLCILIFYIFPWGIGAGDWAYLASLSLLVPLNALLIILQLASCLALIDYWSKKRKGALPFLPFLHDACLIWLLWSHFSFI